MKDFFTAIGTIALGVLLALLVVFGVLGLKTSDQFAASNLLGGSYDNRNTYASTTVFSVGNTAVLIAPTSTGRNLLRIVSGSAVNTTTGMILSYTKAGTVSNGEVLVSPYVIGEGSLYTGAIYAISNVTGTISVTDFSNR
jgi:hypothetical protein